MSFVRSAPLVTLALLVARCVVPERQPIARSHIHADGEKPLVLPELSIVRQTLGQPVSVQHEWRSVRDFDTDLFGPPGLDADASCIAGGLEAEVPNAEILPTAEFWKALGPVTHEVKLSARFVEPLRSTFDGLRIDALVLANDRQHLVKSVVVMGLVVNSVEGKLNERMSALVIDPKTQRVRGGAIPSSTATWTMGNYLTFPLLAMIDKFESLCFDVGRVAAPVKLHQIEPPRVLILAVDVDPTAVPRKPLEPGPPSTVQIIAGRIGSLAARRCCSGCIGGGGVTAPGCET